MTRRKAIVAGLALLFLVGCSASQKHLAVTVDTALFEALSDIHTLEQTTLCGQPSCANVTARVTPGWDDARSQGFNKKLLPIVDGGRQLNNQLPLIKAGAPVPQQTLDLINSISSSLNQLAGDFPGGTTKDKILLHIAGVQRVLVTTLTAIMQQKGGA